MGKHRHAALADHAKFRPASDPRRNGIFVGGVNRLRRVMERKRNGGRFPGVDVLAGKAEFRGVGSRNVIESYLDAASRGNDELIVVQGAGDCRTGFRFVVTPDEYHGRGEQGDRGRGVILHVVGGADSALSGGFVNRVPKGFQVLPEEVTERGRFGSFRKSGGRGTRRRRCQYES
mgnify:CR=1 FL=1